MLRWSLRLGSLLGVPVYLHWTFLLLVAWLLAGPLMSGSPEAMTAALRTGGFVLAIFGCVVLHEMGHALAARRYGIATRDITLLPIGGVASLERMPEKPAQELVVALAGPAVNVLIAALIIPAVLATEGLAAFTAGAGRGGAADAVALHRTHFLASLGVVNVFLVVFNMIPALPMDGGRVLRSILAMTLPPPNNRAKATAAAAAVGQVIALGFVIWGLFTGHFLLMLVGAFVFLGAGAEAQAEQVKSALQGLRVRAAMLTRFRTLRASHTLRHAADELLAGSQQDFPVLADDAESDDDAGALVGVLTRTDLVRAMAAGRADDPVSSVMHTSCATVGEDEDLRTGLDRARASAAPEAAAVGCPVIAVVRPAPGHAPDRIHRPAGRIVGLITPDNLTELVMLAGDRSSGTRVPASRSRSIVRS
jgi:Zn-dependent protease